jgi:flagellar basal-body rod modification protein FlgD
MPTASTTPNAAQQTLANLLQQIGAKPAATANAAPPPKTTLGQSDFLKLMTAQMQNQDPFQPQSNTEMIAQMAQFSTVTGIQQLNTTATGIQTDINQNRIATAANFVGKTVLVPGNTALADSTGAVSGAIDLPSSASDVTVNILRSTGVVAKTISLGANPAGLVGFSWDGNDAKGNPVGDSTYTIQAISSVGGTSTAANVDVYGPITSANVPTGTNPQTFTVSGAGTVNLSDIKAIKY